MQSQSSMMQQLNATNRKLWEINNTLTAGMTQAWMDEWRTALKINTNHVQTLAKIQGPAELAAANWQFGVNYAEELGSAARTRVGLLSDALRNANRTLAGVTQEPVKSIYEAAETAMDEAEDAAEQVRSDAEDVIEADLERISGVGPAFADELRKNGVVSVQHVASLNLDEIALESHPLNAMHGHIENGEWIEQARALLARGEAA